MQAKPLSDDTRRLQHAPFFFRQEVEAGSKNRVDALRHADLIDRRGGAPACAVAHDEALVDEHVDELFAEQRRAGGAFDDLAAQILRKRLDLEQSRDKCGRFQRIEWIERDGGCVCLAGAPAAAQLEKFWTGHADDEHRNVGHAIGELLDQRHDGRLGPLHIVDHDDERSAVRDRLDVVAYGPSNLAPDTFRRRVGHDRLRGFEAKHRGEPRAHSRSLWIVAQKFPQPSVELGQGAFTLVGKACAGVLPQHLDEGPVGDAAAIGEAAAAQDPRARVREPGQRFADQARFPDPRSADDGEQMRPPILRDAREGIQEQPQLAVAADKRSVQARDAPHLHRNLASRTESSMSHQRLGLAFGGNGCTCLVFDCVARELMGERADQDLTGLRALLKSGGHVHGVAADHELAIVGCRRDGLAGVDAHADLELGPAVPDLERGANRALWVVVVHHRHAEDDHRRISGELLHGPAVCGGYLADAHEVARHHRAHHLRVALGRNLRRAHHVGEEDGHDLALLGHGPILP